MAGVSKRAREERVPVTTNEHGDEEHPAFGMIQANRVSSAGGPNGGKVLFDSDIAHNHYVVLKIMTATRRRQLHRDWIHEKKHLVEVAMSEAQWASMISSMNTSGVPCTINWVPGTGYTPELDFDSRLDETHKEVRKTAEDSIADVKAARDKYEAHKTVGNLRDLHFAIENMPANFEFAAKSLTEHAENVVQKSRADIEAMVVLKARQLGIEPADAAELIGVTMNPAALESPEEEEAT